MTHPSIHPLALSAILCAPLAALAQEPPAPSAPAKPTGILPIPSYAGDLATRPLLLGDFDGSRTDLAAKGLTFEVQWNQTVQSVADGGRNETTRYSGGLDYFVNLDLDRAGLLPGAAIKLRAESRYGRSVNAYSGLITPVNMDAMFPLTDELDDDIGVTVTNLNYTQFLSPTFALLLGKIDTADGDANEFAGGRGVSQFMNSNMVANGVFIVGLPYSTLAVGAVWLPSPQLQVTATVANAADSSTTSGFDDFGEGYLLSLEANFQYNASDLPGGITAGGFYVGSDTFTKLGSHLTPGDGGGLALPTDDSTWSIYANAWQYLWVADKSKNPIALTNGEPDRQGVGLFARAGLSDDDTNPIDWAFSGGIGGRGLIPGRERDTFGLGAFYNHIITTRLTGLAGIDDHNSGVELYYSIAITPAAKLTLDAQWLDSAQPDIDDALVFGVRLALRF